MRSPFLLASIVAALSASPALARSHGLACTGRPYQIDADRQTGLPRNTATQPITIRARFEISARNYTIESVTGSAVVPTGRVRFGGYNDHGPVVRGEWRGEDGRQRYFMMSLDLRNGQFRLFGWTENPGCPNGGTTCEAVDRQAGEYFFGTCTILD